jgi:hypothetical protein
MVTFGLRCHRSNTCSCFTTNDHNVSMTITLRTRIDRLRYHFLMFFKEFIFQVQFGSFVHVVTSCHVITRGQALSCCIVCGESWHISSRLPLLLTFTYFQTFSRYVAVCHTSSRIVTRHHPDLIHFTKVQYNERHGCSIKLVTYCHVLSRFATLI